MVMSRYQTHHWSHRDKRTNSVKKKKKNSKHVHLSPWNLDLAHVALQHRKVIHFYLCTFIVTHDSIHHTPRKCNSVSLLLINCVKLIVLCLCYTQVISYIKKKKKKIGEKFLNQLLLYSIR